VVSEEIRSLELALKLKLHSAEAGGVRPFVQADPLAQKHANGLKSFRVYCSPKVEHGSIGFHAFGLSPFFLYNAPLCCIKLGNWL
jgi:hypothetical protein